MVARVPLCQRKSQTRAVWDQQEMCRSRTDDGERPWRRWSISTGIDPAD